MSEPMSAVEIEDVLSSIRRLVSEDLRPLARSGARAGGGSQGGGSQGGGSQGGGPQLGKPASQPETSTAKLILTPALRVVAETEPSGLGQVVASVSAAVDAQSEEWESETGDIEVMQAEAGADWFDLAAQDAQAAGLAAVDAEMVVEAEVVAVAAAGAAAGVDAEAVELPRQETADLVPGWAQQDVAGADLPEDDAGDGALHQADMARADAAPEILAGNIEPDQAWADEAEARVIAELEDRGVAGAALAADEGGFAYEEQVLRELVRDIIREELQGGLGERITRNIRKLVRAEIARALATQALD